jgi:hypothetical protein
VSLCAKNATIGTGKRRESSYAINSFIPRDELPWEFPASSNNSLSKVTLYKTLLLFHICRYPFSIRIHSVEVSKTGRVKPLKGNH